MDDFSVIRLDMNPLRITAADKISLVLMGGKAAGLDDKPFVPFLPRGVFRVILAMLLLDLVLEGLEKFLLLFVNLLVGR